MTQSSLSFSPLCQMKPGLVSSSQMSPVTTLRQQNLLIKSIDNTNVLVIIPTIPKVFIIIAAVLANHLLK